MKTSTASIALIGLLALAVPGTPATAGDWNYGTKDLPGMRGTAVPVPAPTPVPVYEPKWYLRGDVGVSVGGEPGSSESGLLYGQSDSPGATGPVPFGFGSSSFTSSSVRSDFPTGAVWGVGVGYYWSPSLRFDLTADVRSHGEVKVDGTYQYTSYNYNCCGNYVPTTTQVDGTVSEKTIMRTGIFLANAYYDFGHFRHFRPYIGLGLGFAYNELERKNTTIETTCDTTTIPSCATSTVRASGTYSSSSKDHTVTLAAAVTTGFSYEVHDGTHLDFNYRFLYTGATHADLSYLTDSSRIKIDDMYEHQFRAGVRFDIH